MELDDKVLTRVVVNEVRRFLPDAPEKPMFAEIVRWDEAVCLESPGQFQAMHELRQNHLHDVKGLHLAGEYMYLISSVEGALRSGEDAAASIIDRG